LGRLPIVPSDARQRFGGTIVISRIERGLQRNDTLTTAYHAWLAVA
jgi:hypothetical protein